VSRTTGIAEYVAGGRAGLVVGATTNELIRAITEFQQIAAASELPSWSSRARAAAAENFAWPRVTERFIELYSRLSGTKKNAVSETPSVVQ
ncbi:MAG: hypothetical protein AAFQ82_13380, partial [Myxococcota bacterium]